MVAGRVVLEARGTEVDDPSALHLVTAYLPLRAIHVGHDVDVAAGVHARILASAARAALRPVGLQQKGRSRTWIDDHGWWLVNIEFQPSSWRTGSYLNIGEQHLWCERDHLVFERHERPAGGTAFIKFTGDEAAFEEAMTALAERAVAAVLARRQEHGEGHEALRFVAEAGDDFNAGVALGLLGDVRAAAARLNGAIHPAYHAQAARYRDSLVHGQLEAIAATAVDQTRAHLKLPPAERTWHT
jgi:hypothetical protein